MKRWYAVSDLWAAVEITTTDGQKLVGTVVSESETEVVLSQVGGKTTIPAVKIKNRAVSKKSLMPPRDCSTT